MLTYSMRSVCGCVCVTVMLHVYCHYNTIIIVRVMVKVAGSREGMVIILSPVFTMLFHQLVIRTSSVPRHADFYAAPRNSPIATEFAACHRKIRNCPIFATFMSNSIFFQAPF